MKCRKIVKYENTVRVFDFYIPVKRLLIEADGDYWHANPLFYNENNLNEAQKKNLLNDRFKNEIAKKLKFNLVRFFENEIMKENFEEKFSICLKNIKNIKNEKI